MNQFDQPPIKSNQKSKFHKNSAHVFVGKLDKRTVAIKKFISTTSITASVMQNVVREIELSLRLKHPNIIEIYGVSLMLPHVALLLEYMSRGYYFNQNNETNKTINNNNTLRIIIRSVANGTSKSAQTVRNVICRSRTWQRRQLLTRQR